MFRVNLPCLCPLPLVLSLGIITESLALFSLHARFRYVHTWIRIPRSFPSPGWITPILSVFPHKRDLLFIHLFCTSTGFPPVCPCVLSTSGLSSPGGSYQGFVFQAMLFLTQPRKLLGTVIERKHFWITCCTSGLQDLFCKAALQLLRSQQVLLQGVVLQEDCSFFF